jgi:hypothetical protein
VAQSGVSKILELFAREQFHIVDVVVTALTRPQVDALSGLTSSPIDAAAVPHEPYLLVCVERDSVISRLQVRLSRLPHELKSPPCNATTPPTHPSPSSVAQALIEHRHPQPSPTRSPGLPAHEEVDPASVLFLESGACGLNLARHVSTYIDALQIISARSDPATITSDDLA